MHKNVCIFLLLTFAPQAPGSDEESWAVKVQELNQFLLEQGQDTELSLSTLFIYFSLLVAQI